MRIARAASCEDVEWRPREEVRAYGRRGWSWCRGPLALVNSTGAAGREVRTWRQVWKRQMPALNSNCPPDAPSSSIAEAKPVSSRLTKAAFRATTHTLRCRRSACRRSRTMAALIPPSVRGTTISAAGVGEERAGPPAVLGVQLSRRHQHDVVGPAAWLLGHGRSIMTALP